MINVFTDRLFRLGIGYIAAQHAVAERTERYERFQNLMVKLRQAEEQPREVMTTTGHPYVRVPSAEGYNPTTAKLQQAVKKLPDNVLNTSIDTILSLGEVVEQEALRRAQGRLPVKLTETAREEPLPPNQIIRWDENTWLRWHPEKNNYLVMKNPPKPQSRLA